LRTERSAGFADQAGGTGFCVFDAGAGNLHRKTRGSGNDGGACVRSDQRLIAGRPMGLRFTKMHGLGNDFMVLDARASLSLPDDARIRAMADRHTGIGFDQLLSLRATRLASPRTPSATPTARSPNNAATAHAASVPGCTARVQSRSARR
jgi:hypothetical protein